MMMRSVRMLAECRISGIHSMQHNTNFGEYRHILYLPATYIPTHIPTYAVFPHSAPQIRIKMNNTI